MTASRLLSAPRLRSVAVDILTNLPLPLGLGVLNGLWLGMTVGIAVTAVGIVALLIYAFWHLRRLGRDWLIRQLNTLRPDMEDSADLLFAGENLNVLQKLQRGRLQHRLATVASPDLRPAWPWRTIAIIWGVTTLMVLVLTAATLYAPTIVESRTAVTSAAAGAPVLTSQSLSIRPPAYTGLPVRSEAVLDTKAPQGSRLEWRLRFTPQTRAVDLVFHDGRRIAMTKSGDDWAAAVTLDASALYRIAPAGAPESALHRLDVVVDAPPQIKVITPDRSLSIFTPGQRKWPLVFEVSDDYGVASSGQLRLTLAQGEGENITFRERTIAISGAGGPGQKRFAIQLDLTELGYARGDDLVAQLSVSDTRSPGPQIARSPSLILRWPSDLGNESTGLEGLVKRTLPAYFRSQRQIIIDAEALLKEKKKLSEETFLSRSDSIGVDQRILRLRYGQFLGEEAEGDGDGAADEHHDEPAAPATFGADNGLEEIYGHTHDEAEAATLLDPETRAILKLALDEMWQSELHLRQGHPELALPHAYKALEYIKKVQQSTRIFLSRVGPELPPIDDARRMTGKREGIASRSSELAAATQADAPVIAAWNALADVPGNTAPFDLQPLETWLRVNDTRLADPLAVYAAIDAVRRDPACAECRAALRNVLWGVLARPPAEVRRRPPPDSAGNRYLDALRGSQ